MNSVGPETRRTIIASAAGFAASIRSLLGRGAVGSNGEGTFRPAFPGDRPAPAILGGMVLWPLFMIGQAAVLPVLVPGSEVRLVSPDLLRVHATGRVTPAGVLDMEGSLPPGLEVRMLIFPPDAGPDETAAALAGATALTARVSDDGRDLRVVLPSEGEPVAWRQALRAQDIELRLPGEPPSNGAP